MNIISRIIEWIKNVFNKKQGIKMLEEPKTFASKGKRMDFITNLKVNSKVKRKKVETLVCPGDGLGIQSEITY